jgi:hypothetical protein
MLKTLGSQRVLCVFENKSFVFLLQKPMRFLKVTHSNTKTMKTRWGASALFAEKLCF